MACSIVSGVSLLACGIPWNFRFDFFTCVSNDSCFRVPFSKQSSTLSNLEVIEETSAISISFWACCLRSVSHWLIPQIDQIACSLIIHLCGYQVTATWYPFVQSQIDHLLGHVFYSVRCILVIFVVPLRRWTAPSGVGRLLFHGVCFLGNFLLDRCFLFVFCGENMTAGHGLWFVLPVRRGKWLTFQCQSFSSGYAVCSGLFLTGVSRSVRGR